MGKAKKKQPSKHKGEKNPYPVGPNTPPDMIIEDGVAYVPMEGDGLWAQARKAAWDEFFRGAAK